MLALFFQRSLLCNTIIQYILLKLDYNIYNWHSNTNTDGLVNRLASNLVILNQAHRVAWLIWQDLRTNKFCVGVRLIAILKDRIIYFPLNPVNIIRMK